MGRDRTQTDSPIDLNIYSKETVSAINAGDSVMFTLRDYNKEGHTFLEEGDKLYLLRDDRTVQVTKIVAIPFSYQVTVSPNSADYIIDIIKDVPMVFCPGDKVNFKYLR